MVNAYPLLSVLLIFALSLLVVRIGSVALRMTGLSPDVASFRAVSAFSGAGYTTGEAERTVSTSGRPKTVKAHEDAKEEHEKNLEAQGRRTQRPYSASPNAPASAIASISSSE